MKGKLIKKEDEYLIEYLEEGSPTIIPLHPAELKETGLWKLKNKEVKFEIVQEYLGVRITKKDDVRTYVNKYQNYAKLKR